MLSANEPFAAATCGGQLRVRTPEDDFSRGQHHHPVRQLCLRSQHSVLVLDKPIPGKIRPASLSSREVHAQETLVMAGYGYGMEFGQIFGLRFIRRDKVLGQAPGSGGRFFYEQQGAFLYNGFKGGPCFQANRGRNTLAGIASIGTAQELSFTSTYAYRDWLDSEIRRAAKLVRAPKKRP